VRKNLALRVRKALQRESSVSNFLRKNIPPEGVNEVEKHLLSLEWACVEKPLYNFMTELIN
jgi:hypothetical protein